MGTGKISRQADKLPGAADGFIVSQFIGSANVLLDDS